MAVGAILFVIGLTVLVRFNIKKTKSIKFFGKTYGRGRFVFTTILSGVCLIMISVQIQKLFPPEPVVMAEEAPVTLSSNLKYELNSILGIDESNPKLMKAIERFQKEYQDAVAGGDRKTMELLILEMSFLIRTELEKQDYPYHQIGSEVERIMQFLKQRTD